MAASAPRDIRKGISMLSTISSATQGPLSAGEVEKAPSAGLPVLDTEPAPTASLMSQSEVASVSVLGRQLSDSAERASQRELTMSRDELAAYAAKQKSRFLFDGYQAGKARHDLETPQTDDPELLNRARQATEYVNRSRAGDLNAKSPFAGLSRDQLILIAYDDQGGYTINERQAAWRASAQMEYKWAQGAIARAQLESSMTGKAPVFLREVLEYYKCLPMIERVQDRYPWNYEAEMEAKIAEELALPAGGKREPQTHILNLYDILAAMTDPEKKRLEREDPALPETAEVSPDLNSPPLTTNN